ncbi:MAG: hypothetical protein A2Y34_12965 [Spirochaetes bacterium GWC1_27_15]|nr:MAG: hypothetical protein A2Y34_12965 [Spirochaetes bacterium GWC1_27_15]
MDKIILKEFFFRIEKDLLLFFKLNQSLCDYYSVSKIHKTRILLRKFLSFFEISSFFIYSKKINNYKIIINKNIKKLNRTRDIDVILSYFDEIYNLFPDIKYFYQYIKIKKDKLSKKIVKHFKKGKILENKKNLVYYLDFIKEKILSNDKIKLEEGFQEIIYKTYKKVIKATNLINIDNIKSFHKTRICIKELRYTVELLKYILEIDNDIIIELKYQQEILGKIHDMSIFLKYLEKYKESDLFSLKNYLIKKQQVLINDFMQTSGKLTTLFRGKD